MTTIEQISNHLGFLGYESTVDGEVTRAVHASRWNLVLKDYQGGVLITSYLGSNDHAKNKRHRQAYLEMINSMNQEASVTRFYADNDTDLVMEALWLGDYDRVSFGDFMEKWDVDTRTRLLQSEASNFLD